MVSDSGRQTRLREVRDAIGLSREQVCRRLDPPVSVKTLERWEADPLPLLRKRWRLVQLAEIYETTAAALISVNGNEAP